MPWLLADVCGPGPAACLGCSAHSRILGQGRGMGNHRLSARSLPASSSSSGQVLKFAH